ncbi:histidine--tRNA ligase [Mucilaginibacter sp. L3T2-6]|uniref:histidine--tRNA ligase n=1 Tax=Mucilaginibacter sp. L3T2-6 TaxID=3062491 RepID=UPI0026744F61|nr:histidine--tRNA ligase [Mucilaginibacter sp. L3T2-6]MDO3643143.1 histidine--tRNA ligase [Mucilaginibacter sp. L3T2-6]MDV6217759.1 histidine--tRNA ligase [Mucilaginibacter sp. L3T2-6]
MASIKPSVPKGTRDFSPTEMVRRNYIFDTIKSVFRKYGYQQIETPSMENLSTLTGKYGDEGDKLIFKILNNGALINRTLLNLFEGLNNELRENKFDIETYDSDFKGEEELKRTKFIDRSKNQEEGAFYERVNAFDKVIELTKKDNGLLASEISEKALRYDLTVPFARYVVMHQNEIAFPFKRFQVQPVWRADRPQRGRYREFYQCDADVVGSDSLLNEAEFVLIYDEALSKLGLRDFTIKINNRKILSGIAELIDKSDNIIDLTVAIDKLDKIGLDGVKKELMERGFSAEDIEKIEPVILLEGSNAEKLASLRHALAASATGLKGCDEIETVFNYIANCPLQTAKLELDITLARGLNYYTGAIFEVKTNEVAMGSIGGGGRYDDLTGMFGLKGLTGVGISFGADRIYDVMDELNLFPEATSQITKLLICCFDKEGEKFAFPILQKLRSQDVNAELYPAGAKLKKQLDYANNKNIPYTIFIGSEEIESGLLTVKDMRSGTQEKMTVEQVLAAMKG